MSLPDRPLELRLWLGWRRPDLAGGHPAFVQRLAEEFLPRTWDVMPLHGLRLYLPSILRPSSADAGLPDEVALLGHVNRIDYESRTDDPEADRYGKLHNKLFVFGGQSRSDWASTLDATGPDEPPLNQPLHLRAAAGGPSWQHADAVPHLLLLRHTATSPPDPRRWLQALAGRWGDVAIWPTAGFSVLWFCARQAIELAEVRDQLSAPGAAPLDVAAFHVAEAVTFPRHAHGVPAEDDRSWIWRITARALPRPGTGTGNRLRQQMQDALHDWHASVPVAWRDVLSGCAPDFAAVNDSLVATHGADIVPALQGRAPAGAPAFGHLWRALELVAPADVRVVLLGQDPYPDPRRATGVAFEQGDLRSWDDTVASSLQRLMQALVRHRWPDQAAAPGRADWTRIQPVLLARQHAGTLVAPPELFPSWARQGVLSLNTGFTWSTHDDAVQAAHLALWAPVLKALLRHLVAREGAPPLVAMSFGTTAQNALAAMELTQGRAHLLHSQHPQSRDLSAADHVLSADDPWSRINTRLDQLGQPPIAW